MTRHTASNHPIRQIPAVTALVLFAILAALLASTPVHADHGDDGDHADHHSTTPTLSNASANDTAITAAMGVLDDFMAAFNQRDMPNWAATLNYPHVRFASGEVKVWQSLEEFAAIPPFDALKKTSWHHSSWLSRDVILASPSKVHIATVFQRFDASNQSIGVYESLYIVTQVNDRWGVQARSSLAP